MRSKHSMYSLAFPLALLWSSQEAPRQGFPLRGIMCPLEQQLPEIVETAYKNRADIGQVAMHVIAHQSEHKCKIYFEHTLRGEIKKLTRTLERGGYTFYFYEVEILGEIADDPNFRRFFYRYATPVIRYTFTNAPLELISSQHK